MDKVKLFDRYCPKCGELYKTCDLVKISLGAGVQANMSCEQGHKWSEFYCLTYTGFWWDGKRYDSFGNALSND